jgi:hypothetical protein
MKYKFHLAKFNFKKSYKPCDFTHREARLPIDKKITIGVSQPTHGKRGSLFKDFALHLRFHLNTNQKLQVILPRLRVNRFN